MNRVSRCIALLAMAFAPATFAHNSASLWQGLASGEYVAVMRHATAPGTGDPVDFALGDCSSQRNLSDAGRAEARAIGARFRQHGIVSARVRSSHWYRCLKTARLLDLGRVAPPSALNSFYQNRRVGAQRTQAVLKILGAPADGLRVLITHQVNITALTDVYPSSGEIIVVEPGEVKLHVVGRLDPPVAGH